MHDNTVSLKNIAFNESITSKTLEKLSKSTTSIMDFSIRAEVLSLSIIIVSTSEAYAYFSFDDDYIESLKRYIENPLTDEFVLHSLYPVLMSQFNDLVEFMNKNKIDYRYQNYLDINSGYYQKAYDSLC